MKLEGSIALVTGANRGIGRAQVEELLARKARRVYAAARNRDSLEALVALAPERVVPLALDVTDELSVERARQQASDVELVVNNAGSLHSFSVLASPLDALESDLRVNYLGVLRVTRAFTAASDTRVAALVNVLSVASLSSMPAIGGYSASKAAAFSLTQSLRAELAARKIQVFGVFPGPVDTDMTKGFDLVKTPARDVARAIAEGVESEQLDIFPDPMARDVAALFWKDPRALERRFAAG